MACGLDGIACEEGYRRSSGLRWKESEMENCHYTLEQRREGEREERREREKKRDDDDGGGGYGVCVLFMYIWRER